MAVNTSAVPNRRPERNESLDGEKLTFGSTDKAQENQYNSSGATPVTPPVHARIKAILTEAGIKQ